MRQTDLQIIETGFGRGGHTRKTELSNKPIGEAKPTGSYTRRCLPDPLDSHKRAALEINVLLRKKGDGEN